MYVQFSIIAQWSNWQILISATLELWCQTKLKQNYTYTQDLTITRFGFIYCFTTFVICKFLIQEY